MGGSTGADVAERTATEAADQARRGERGSPRWRGGARLSLAAVLAAVVAVYHRDLVRSFSVLDHLNFRWFALAVLAESVSVLSFAFSRRRLLAVGAEPPPRRRAMVAITVSGSAMAMSLPFAGTGLAALYEYRQFRRRGVDAATTGWTLAVSGIFSTSSLALLLVAGAVLGGQGAGAAAGFAGAALYLMPGVAVLLAIRYDRVRATLSSLLLRVARGISWRPRRRSHWNRLDGLPAQLEEFLDRIASLRPPPRGYLAVYALATLNWAADCAALALAVHATGLPVPWHALLLAWGAGAAVGSTGLTPGGFGLVELTVAAALTAGGLPAAGALASVLAYRLVNFWLVLGVGWLLMLRPAANGGPAGEPGH
ncbi:MAG TPA: lysylphosphatidylglycerol synthase transmembrane domain-containing protein [Streptosporangiaceae bacterium]